MCRADLNTKTQRAQRIFLKRRGSLIPKCHRSEICHLSRMSFVINVMNTPDSRERIDLRNLRTVPLADFGIGTEMKINM